MYTFGRCAFLWFAGIVACMSVPVLDALAQPYPAMPIRIVVGYSPGGGADTTARMLAQKLPDHLGQPVVVENRPGANAAIADEYVAKSPPDGYTLLLMTASEAITPALRKLPYDLERDFAPVSLVVTATFVLVVHPSVPARNVKELIGLARSHPGKLSYGSSGVGRGAHLAGALFNLMADVGTIHVPYKGGGQSSVATASGEVDLNYLTIPSALPFLSSGRLRPLAVTTAKRATLMPEIPTLDESGLAGYDRSSWHGLLAPAGVPKNIIAQLNAVIAKVANTSEMRDLFRKGGVEPQTTTPEQFGALIRREIVENAKLVNLTRAKSQ